MFRSPLTRWLILGAALVATVVASIWPTGGEAPGREVVAPLTRRTPAAPPSQQATAQSGVPDLGERLERAPARAKVEDLFDTTDLNPPPPRVKPAPPPPPPEPTAPPFPYTVSGSAADATGPIVVFHRQNQVFAIRIGDVLEQTYRLEAIGPQSVTVTYLPLGLAQSVPIQR